MPQISKHFTYEELTQSQTAVRKGLDNVPDDEAVANLKALCDNVLEPLRAKLRERFPKAFVIISSGYRAPAVNKAVGGSKNSQHMRGQAADILVSGMKTADLFKFIRECGLEYDQCIEEFGRWVHISWAGKEKNRNEDLIARKDATGKKTIYSKP